MNIELTCLNCSALFSAEYKHRSKKFCSRGCFFEYSKKHKIIGRKVDDSLRVARKCLVCSNNFTVRDSVKKTICSDKCRKIWNADPINKEKRLSLGRMIVNKNHGVNSIFEKEDFKNNYSTLISKKYGVENPMKHPDFVNKLQDTLRSKHLLTLLPKLLINRLELLDSYSVNKSGSTSLSYNFKCLVCNNIFTSTVMGSGKIPICRKCNPLIQNSKLESLIRDFMNENDIVHLDNNRKILNGIEMDLYLDKYKLAIEVNGNYFHSEYHGGKDKNYHLNKTNVANQLDIRLVHILEDEILQNKEIVLSRLRNLLNLNTNKIFARKCKIKEVSKNDSKNFLITNHIQGDSIDKIRYGLYYDDKLVSLMTFGSPRRALGNRENKAEQFELVRFANIINTNVIGGFSRLLNHFIVNHKPHRIISYADIRWSGLNANDTVYAKNGFKYVGNTPPNYWYVKTNQFGVRYHRYNFRKDKLVKEGFSRSMSEWEIMKLKGYDRIWDCGSMKFEFNIMNTGASFDTV